jgi:pimeloyl-ACP methyl ester carboxylesterase
MHSAWPIPEGARVAVPTGYTEFPAEILRPPRSVAEKVYNIQRWVRMDKGGHFAALEQPEALAREIRAFFRPLRR